MLDLFRLLESHLFIVNCNSIFCLVLAGINDYETLRYGLVFYIRDRNNIVCAHYLAYECCCLFWIVNVLSSDA